MKTLTNFELTNHVVDLMSISLEIVAALDGQLPLKVDLSRQRQDLSEMAGTIQQQLGFVQGDVLQGKTELREKRHETKFAITSL